MVSLLAAPGAALPPPQAEKTNAAATIKPQLLKKNLFILFLLAILKLFQNFSLKELFKNQPGS
jgi:hypothetical protein